MACLLRRLLGVVEEPAPALAAEQPGLDHAREQRRRRVERLLELGVHRVGDRLDGVEPDHVGERQRPHRVRAALDHAGVDVVGRREARLEHADRGQHVGHEQRVHDEAGAVLRADHPLAERVDHEVLGAVGDVAARDDRRDELHQAHHRHRVEEVQAEHVLGAVGRHGQLHDRDRRRVRRQDRLVVDHDLAEVAEHLELLVLELAHRLHHELAVGELADVGDEADPRQRGRGGVVVELARLHRALERRLDARSGPAATAASLMSQTVTSTPALADDLGDPRAHEPGAHHTDAFDGLAHVAPRSAPSLRRVAAV